MRRERRRSKKERNTQGSKKKRKHAKIITGDGKWKRNKKY